MPVALHAGYAAGCLLLWAEGPITPDAHAGRPRRGRARHGGTAVPPHPQALTVPALLAGLAHASAPLADVLAPAPAQTVTAWLPTAGAGPLPSPGAGGLPESIADPELRPWTVPALVLSADALAALLTRFQGEGLGPGLVAAPDLMFWAGPLRLAAAIAFRGAMLPSLRRRPDGGFAAVWEPLFSPRERAALADLARSMPGACRALAGGPETVPPSRLLAEWIASIVDGLPRAAAAEPPAGRTPHDRWLAALTAPKGVLEGKPDQWVSLAGAVRDWAAPVAVRHDAAYRLCFRLEEPLDAAVDAWHVRYILEAADDPSLRLDADRVWPPRSGVPQQARDVLLAALGRAAALVPEVARTLQGDRPIGYALDVAGAHAFLTETASLLEQAGFGVMLPAWWVGRGGTRLVARGHARAPKFSAKGGLGLEAVVEFDWSVALGQETLTREELERLAALKEPLVQIRGQWVQVGQEEIRAALALWQGRASRRGTLRDALRLAAGAGPDGGAGLPVELDGADQWIRSFLARPDEDGASFSELPPPPRLQATLRPYQMRGYSWLAFLAERGLGACLADDMGLGKTLQTLALITRDWEECRRPTLLVCPTSVLGNWRKEVERFAPHLPVLTHHGLERLRADGFRAEADSSAMVLTTYPLLARDQELLGVVRWRGLVLDEAQNVKNAETKQARAARALASDYRVALTGTPVENSVGDLWSLMEFLNPGLLGGQAEYRQRFFTPIQVDRDPEAIARLRRLTGPFTLRRLKTDPAIVADLPAKNEMKVYCTLTREQASLYAAVVADLERCLSEPDEGDGIGRRGQILAALSKLKQVCNHPAQFLGDGSPLPGRSGKVERLVEMVQEAVAAGDRLLVFTQFAQMGALLQQHLHSVLGQEVLFLHGAVARGKRERMVESFQQGEGGPPVFLLSLKAGGTGLNLTAANRVIHFDRWWNPAVEDQATDRAFRIGQRRDVQVHKFVCAGTLEERIDAMIDGKRELAERVVGTGEAWLTELSLAELRDVLALRPEAVED